MKIDYGFRFGGEALGMKNFNVFYWCSKNTASFNGKGALSAKRWIWSELGMDDKTVLPKIDESVVQNMSIDDISKVKMDCSDMIESEVFSKSSELLKPRIGDTWELDRNESVGNYVGLSRCNETKSSNKLWIGQDALDIEMPSQMDSSNKVSAKVKRQLFECRKVLCLIQNKSEAKAFMEPVDWKMLDLPDYPKVIKNPMDLHTVEIKLDTGAYWSALELSGDMELIWANAMKYNRPYSGIWKVAKSLRTLWRRKFRHIGRASDLSQKHTTRVAISPDSPNIRNSVLSPIVVRPSQGICQRNNNQPRSKEYPWGLSNSSGKNRRRDDFSKMLISSPGWEDHGLADFLAPGDIKGLTKQELKDLKEGKRSPIHLVEKYSGQLGPSTPKNPLVKQYNENGHEDETCSVRIAPDESWVRPDDLTTLRMDGCDPISISNTLSVSPPNNISVQPVGDICSLHSEEHPVNASKLASSTEIFPHPSSAKDSVPLSPLQPKCIQIPEKRERIINSLHLEEITNPKTKFENLEEKKNLVNSPPNMITSDALKSRVRSRLDGDSSSQSASLSKVVHFANWHNDQLIKRNDQHSALHCFTEKDRRCDKNYVSTHKQKKRDLSTPVGSPVSQHGTNNLELWKGAKNIWEWCKCTVEEFQKMPEAEMFLKPVDWVKLKIPLWPNIIKNPMDLRTIMQNLDQNLYLDIFEFDRDMNLVWSNAKSFFRPDSAIFSAAEFLSGEWSQRFASMKNNAAVKNTMEK